MNSAMDDPIFLAIVAAVAGLLIGYFAGRRSAPSAEITRELEQQLVVARAERERFEQQVDAHFSETASKVGALTNSYREVYEHLAKGASDLCSNDESKKSFEALATPDAAGLAAIEADSVRVEAPRDYAERGSASDPGVLDERFGLDGEDKPPQDSTTRSK